ncbi:PD-(D/E)XK nuclease family protein [Agromyces aerolatus]|uniref:PD-(D/E)XK nuclease family protein n=1 Tax=Agromyces sp. LY-1074 TaxID=3074080 RepID=UPI0028631A79|nr:MULTISPECIES: PD-(D/E)XK nuclease family protein [unclassified Agromyces]MDR5698935.1 PD-(D/E)XK nuclease family protein [Agromyces sp. LY-1074]MDR5705287.1 PD-(D/E)XK nuclease family protein [Agromyces sp. LY-1358]
MHLGTSVIESGHVDRLVVGDPVRQRVLGLPDDVSAAVFGAPGTGKTTLAVELVAERVERRGYEPDEVLVVTASRATATALRDRLAVRLGLTTRGPLARTANSIAFQLVRAATGEPVTLLTGSEHDQLIAELLEGGVSDGGGPAWPDPFTDDVRRLRGFRAELRELLMRAVEHGVDGAGLRRLGEVAGRPEWVAAGAFLDEYADVKELVRGAQFDSAELGAYAAAVVASAGADAPSLLGTLARLRLIVVDDAQEATQATAALLSAFAARGVSVIALGDPDVASNGFRGGRPELLGSLGRLLPGRPVERIELDRVRRGRPELRGIVADVTARIGTALGGTHRAAEVAVTGDETVDDAQVDVDAGVDGQPGAAGEGERMPRPVLGIEAPSHAAECQSVAALLREQHLLGGIPWSDMAVVLRSGGDVPAFERGLALADVPTAGAVARVPLRDAPAAAALLAAASLALDREPLTAELAVSLLTGPLGRLDAVGLRRLRLSLRHEELAADGDRTADELLVDALGAPGGFETIDAAPARRAGRLAKLLAAARAVAGRSGTIEEVLWALWDGSGLAAEWAAQAAGTGVLADEANRALDAAVALFASAQRFVEREPGAPSARFVEEVLASELPEDSLAPQRSAETVFVGTPAALVGREFALVVVAGLQEGVWPNLRPRGTLLHSALLPRAVAAVRAGEPAPQPEGAAEARASVRSDELRLFALAVSRATQQLVLSCTSNDDEQPSVLMAYASERLRPTRRRPLHLRGMVGALRADLAEAARRGSGLAGGPADASAAVHPRDTAAREAAAALARLAEEGIPGAHPDEWYGLREPSTTAPLVDLDGDPEALVDVSPSQIDRAEESALGWFVDHVASPPSGLAASIGTIVHAVVEAAGDRTGDDLGVEALWSEVERRLAELRIESGWVAERERRGARRMTEGAAAYLAAFVDDGKVLLGAEGRFSIVAGRARVTGTIDRVEASADGTTVIVDLKTGRTPPSGPETAAHPQLAAYQLAARGGEVPNAGRHGGAKLVYVAKPTASTNYTERAQQPFDDDAEHAFLERLDRVARTMAAAEFETSAELPFRSRFSAWHYRVQIVPAVSA